MIKNKEYKVYKITCLVNNKIYFGYTSKSLKSRYSGHRQQERDTIISRTIRKYGDDNFAMELLYTFGNETDAKKKEIELIKENRTNYIKYPEGNGMNMTDGGEGTCGHKHSLEIREHWSKTRKGKMPASVIFANKIKEKTGKHPFSKTVYCFTKDGELVKEFVSVVEASKYFNVAVGNISKCCHGISKTLKGYVFQYENEFKKRNLEKNKNRMFGSKNPMSKTVYKFNLRGKLIKIYGSVHEVARELCCSHGKILKYCNNKEVLDDFLYTYESMFSQPNIKQKIRRGKCIGKYDIDTKELVKTYHSVSVAATDNNIDRRTFYKYLKNDKKLKGYIFRYI